MNSKPDVVLIDGAAASTVSVLDRGLHYGDGLFETIACRGGQARFLAYHLERLGGGCERLRIRFGAHAVLRDEIERLASLNDLSLIKVILTRGIATARGYGPKGDETATRVVLRYSWPQEDPSARQDGVVVRVAEQRLGENTVLAGLKHLNRLEHVLARSEWQDPRIAEALLFSSSGLLVSGTMSNVFIVKDGKLRTPRIERCGVAGVMRRVVLQEASRAGIEREECDLIADDLNRADEVFLTNARIGIWPVRALDSRALAPGALTRRLQDLIQPLLGESPHESATQGPKDSEGDSNAQRRTAGHPNAPSAPAISASTATPTSDSKERGHA
jgi:4-amino-4-deoxychorismate lyase